MSAPKTPSKKDASRTDEPKTTQMKKVGNFLIDMERHLGQGQYGKVYLSQEIPDQT